MAKLRKRTCRAKEKKYVRRCQVKGAKFQPSTRGMGYIYKRHLDEKEVKGSNCSELQHRMSLE